MTGDRADRGPEQAAPHYLLGHAGHELARLEAQGAIYRAVTMEALLAAGLVEGMRVLDVGCGTGDVSLAVAGIVGSRGSVVGIDRSAEGLAFAKARAESSGQLNVSFVRCEIDRFGGIEAGAFDALVGRFVLMHQADPAGVLRSALRAVRPEGVVVMIESNMATLLGGTHSFPHSPLYDALVRWKCDVVGRSADIHAGLRLRSTFVAAGLPAPEARLHAPLAGGPDSPYYRYVAESLRSMVPEARRHGIGRYASEDAERVEVALRDATVAVDGVLVVWPVVAAWSRKVD